MFLSRPTPSPFTPATPVSPIPLSGTIDGVQASGPDLPLIANVAGNPVLAGGTRATTVARVILAAVAMGGLALPRYTTVALGSITSPPEGLLVWDDTLNVLKVYDGSAFVPVGGGSVAAADITDAGSAGIDVLRSSTFDAIRTSLGLGDAAIRNTGMGPTNVILGNDTRLTNTRTPSSGSVNASTIDGSDVAGIQSALGLGDAAVRNTGTGPTNVVLGNDARLTDTRNPTFLLWPLCDAHSTVSSVDEVIAQFRFDPSDYYTPPSSLSLLCVASVVSGVTGLLTLRNLTDSSDDATLSWTETSATRKSASLTVPGAAKIYELRWSKANGGILDYALLGSALLRLNWS